MNFTWCEQGVGPKTETRELLKGWNRKVFTQSNEGSLIWPPGKLLTIWPPLIFDFLQTLWAYLALTRFSASRLLNARNVYYGALKGKGDVVAKKLGHDNELDRSLEKAVCHLAGKPPYYCNSAHYIKLLTKQIYSRPLESGSATDHSPSLKLEFGRCGHWCYLLTCLSFGFLGAVRLTGQD